jgi:hypothetical protein
MSNKTEDAVERVELTDKLADFYVSGIAPSPEDVKRAAELGIDTQLMKRTMEECYEPEC